MKWFSSDWHLSHAGVIRMSNRPFSSVEEMDETIIQNTLSKLKKGDDLYLLGDISMKREPTIAALKRLKEARINAHIVIGNHDAKYLIRKFFR